MTDVGPDGTHLFVGSVYVVVVFRIGIVVVNIPGNPSIRAVPTTGGGGIVVAIVIFTIRGP